MDSHRSERVAEALREELEEIVNYELSDSRISFLSVTEVLLAPDLRHALVRVSLGGDASEQRASLHALSNARHYVRRLLASRLDLYRVPDLRFESDVAVEGSARLGRLLKRIRKGRPRVQAPPDAPPFSKKVS